MSMAMHWVHFHRLFSFTSWIIQDLLSYLMNYGSSYLLSVGLSVHLRHRKVWVAGWMILSSVHCFFLSIFPKDPEERGMTTGTSLWCGSGSCWVLPTLHLSWQWSGTGYGFYLKRPELRCFSSYGCFCSCLLSTNFYLRIFFISGFTSFFQMEGLRAHATDWTQNIQNMSVDFRIAGKLDDPFRRRRRKRRHRTRTHDHNAQGTGDNEEKKEQSDSQTESESYSSSFSSSESGSESETDSQATQSEQVPEEKSAETLKDPHLSQPLDYFGENLAFIDESSDAQSGKLHLGSQQDKAQPNSARSRHTKRRRQRRPVPQRTPKVKRSNLDKTEHNGNPKPVPGQ